jgi:hypothetical protein
MGQWSQGGMIMIGDMLNQGLKYRVDALCNELAGILRALSRRCAGEREGLATQGTIRLLRRRSAMCPSPQREARGAFGLK